MAPINVKVGRVEVLCKCKTDNSTKDCSNVYQVWITIISLAHFRFLRANDLKYRNKIMRNTLPKNINIIECD